MTAYVIYDLFQQQPDIRTDLVAGFSQYQDATETRKSHLFHGRYENIYLSAEQIPALDKLLQAARKLASEYLARDELRVGCWFNYMPPGAITTRHNHDDDDELLSAAYYVHVPPDSGDLILYDAEPPTRITPKAGQLIIFPPDIDHEVSRNNSREQRLSIGINFGPVHEED